MFYAEYSASYSRKTGVWFFAGNCSLLSVGCQTYFKAKELLYPKIAEFSCREIFLFYSVFLVWAFLCSKDPKS